jgi:hypothetical protein
MNTAFDFEKDISVFGRIKVFFSIEQQENLEDSLCPRTRAAESL